MILQPAPVSLQRFTFTRDEQDRKILVSEMSDLNGFGRVWDDACDEGLTIISHHTGRHVVYAVDGTDRDNEGELRSWTLRPADRRQADLPTVIVFND